MIKKALSLLGQRILKEPAVVAGALAAALVFIAGNLGIIIDAPTVTSVLTPLVVGFVTRFLVVPASQVVLTKKDVPSAPEPPTPPNLP